MVQGGGGHAQTDGNLLHGEVRVREQGLGHLQVLVCEGARTPAPAPGSGGLKPGAGALAHHGALELGQGREEVNGELAVDRGGVDGLGEGAEADSALQSAAVVNDSR